MQPPCLAEREPGRLGDGLLPVEDVDQKDAASALQRFLFDADLLVASTAALQIAVLYAPDEDDPLSGAKLIAGMASYWYRRV